MPALPGGAVITPAATKPLQQKSVPINFPLSEARMDSSGKHKPRVWGAGFQDSIVVPNPPPPMSLAFSSLQQHFPGGSQPQGLGQNHGGVITRQQHPLIPRPRLVVMLLATAAGRQAQNANNMIAFTKSSFYDCIISAVKTCTNICCEAGRMLH